MQKYIRRVDGSITGDDLQNLVEATIAAILDGGAFGWLNLPDRRVLERYFEGLLLVPGRELFIARQEDGVICGAGLLAHSAMQSELHSPKACIGGLFIAPYARKKGLGRALTTAMIRRAERRGAKVVDCDLRETQRAASALLRSLGFVHWGTHPWYARIHGENVRGLFFSKNLLPASPTNAASKPSDANSSIATSSGAMPAGRVPWGQCSPRSSDLSSPILSRDPVMTVSAPPPSSSVSSPLAQNKTASGLVLYPAIDLKNGACVRLQQGDMRNATHYSDSPGTQAKYFAKAGCRYLHVVDLDGAFAGKSSNITAVQDIIASTSLPVQLGGGLRDLRAVEYWLEAGVSRVILGSVAVKDPDLVRQAALAWPGRIIAGIDARQGRVATEGWAETSELTALELAKRMEDAGVAGIIFTEISRDGMLEGIDLEQTAGLARQISIPVIASGGVGTIAHLRALRETAQEVRGIEGVIIGRAIYDGRISLEEALAVVEGSSGTNIAARKQ